MNLSLFDWLIVFSLFAGLAGIAISVRRYTRSVSDFLAGNRCAGRYLLTMSEGLTSLGLVGTIANFEKFYEAGFAAGWWGVMMAPIGMAIALSGWVNYRYRQTRAMTMAQFFEMRYSRRFRVFAGVVAWGSGILNYGIFPGICARFIVYFCGLPVTLNVAGIDVPTIAPVMALMFAVTLVLTLSGGMVTVMITDFLQAQFINIVFLIVMFFLVVKFAWSDVTATLTAAPPGKSLVNPFDQSGIGDFNVWFFMIFAFKLFYNRLGWQGTQGYNCAAKSPHEAKMAGVLAEWRGGVSYLILMLMPIGAYVLLHNPAFAGEAASINQTIATIGDAQTQKQMTVPVALAHMLPAGAIGLLCAAMMAATIGNDTTFLHAWGSIFIQDVVLPFRKKPLTPTQHMRLLRYSIFGVAVFAFCFSLLFPLRDYVVMYQLVTGAIYLGGSGAVIIGGLYWSRGTTAGAWWGLCTGGVLAVTGALLRMLWPSVPALAEIAPQFPINGAWVALVASVAAVTAYIAGSLLTCREPFNMDKLLHRGQYAIAGDVAVGDVAVGDEAGAGNPNARWKWLGITDEFTRGDRWIFGLKIGWTTFWVVAFVIGTVAALTVGISDHAWTNWWLFTVIVGAVVGVITIVWFLIGGMKDLVALLRTLRKQERDETDNGVVPAIVPPAVEAAPVPKANETTAVAPSVMTA